MTSRSAVLTAILLVFLCGCVSKSRLTADAVGCNVANLDILPNNASRGGSTTDWCARCKGSLYRCIGNASRDKVECRPAKEDDKCG